ncbi:hypothetical protein, partial [Bordetella pertussis]|uniref:hypothetical protein n=1 Tax=Bordetella pertussis TaxID=520 RepID=UPI0021CBFE0F
AAARRSAAAGRTVGAGPVAGAVRHRGADGVAVLALAVTLALARAAPLFVQGEQYSPWLAWLAVLLLVGAAPFLMGGTLPVLLRIDSSQLAVNCQ